MTMENLPDDQEDEDAQDDVDRGVFAPDRRWCFMEGPGQRDRDESFGGRPKSPKAARKPFIFQ